jgi:hypothetical protein
MNERLIHLRVKIKNLADEARTIREEAKKVSGMAKWNLNHHRKTVVRWAARDNLLAYGLLRRVPYEVIERYTENPPDFKAVEKIARRFGGEDLYIEAWINSAKDYLKPEKKDVDKLCA